MRKTNARAAILAILIVIAVVGCGAYGHGELSAAVKSYEADSIAYAAAGDAISAARAAGRVTDAQWSQFVHDQDAVRALDALLAYDLDAWRVGNVKPATYEANAKALHDAQARVIAMSVEVAR